MSTRISLDQIEDGIPKEKLALVSPVSGNDPVTKQYLEDQEFVDGSVTINGKAISTNPVLTKEDVGLGNLPNIPPSDFPISNDTQVVIDNLYKGPYALSRLSVIDQTSFQNLITSYGVTKQAIVLDRDVTFTENYSVPANISFIPSLGRISVAAGKTLTINSPIEAQDQVLFVGDGKVVLAGNSRINTRWFNILGDGVVNEAPKLKALIEQEPYRKIYIPRQTGASYRWSQANITCSNKIIEFENNTFLQGTSALGNGAYLIEFRNCNNITVIGNNLTVDNNKSTYPPSTSGVSGAFKVMSCMNFTMFNTNVTNSGGDSYYVGTGTYGVPNVNVNFTNCVSDGCQRNGWSIINVKKLRMYNCTSKNNGQTGSTPGAGIDFEPNNSSEFLEDIRLFDFVTENNFGAGVLIAPIQLKNANKTMDIIISNHRDKGSSWSAFVGEQPGTLNGQVIFDNPVWEEGKFGAFIAWNWSLKGPKVIVRDAEVINAGSQPFYGLSFTMGVYKRFVNAAGTDPIGNVHFIRPRIVDTRETPRGGTSFYYADGPNQHGAVSNCTLEDPIDLPPSQVPFASVRTSIAISDIHNKLRMNYAANTTVASISLHPYNTNKGATGSVIQTLTNYEHDLNVQKTMKFEVVEPQLYRIQLPAGHTFIGSNVGTSLSLEASTVGYSITIKKVGATQWLVTDIVGTWKNNVGNIAGNSSAMTWVSDVILDTTDFDTLTANGVYNKFGLSPTNPPNAPTREAGTLLVYGTTFKVQKFTTFGSRQVWERSQTNGGLWSAWYRNSKYIQLVFALPAQTIPANSTVSVDIDTSAITGVVMNHTTPILRIAPTTDYAPSLKPITAVMAGPNLLRLFLDNPTNSPVSSSATFVRISVEDLTPAPV